VNKFCFTFEFGCTWQLSVAARPDNSLDVISYISDLTQIAFLSNLV
jgi:hypothetical protein